MSISKSIPELSILTLPVFIHTQSIPRNSSLTTATSTSPYELARGKGNKRKGSRRGDGQQHSTTLVLDSRAPTRLQLRRSTMRRPSVSACEPTATVSASSYVRHHGCGGQREHVRDRDSGSGGREREGRQD
jgi:hypothetical protein